MSNSISFITWCSFLHVSGEQWPSCLLDLYFKLIWINTIFRFFFPNLGTYSYINIWILEIISQIIDILSLFLTFFFLCFTLDAVAPSCPPPLSSREGFLWMPETVQFSHSAMSKSLRPHGLQHTRPPCPSPTAGACANSYPSIR